MHLHTGQKQRVPQLSMCFMFTETRIYQEDTKLQTMATLFIAVTWCLMWEFLATKWGLIISNFPKPSRDISSNLQWITLHERILCSNLRHCDHRLLRQRSSVQFRNSRDEQSVMSSNSNWKFPEADSCLRSILCWQTMVLTSILGVNREHGGLW
jgi:hypothetical protein